MGTRARIVLAGLALLLGASGCATTEPLGASPSASVSTAEASPSPTRTGGPAPGATASPSPLPPSPSPSPQPPPAPEGYRPPAATIAGGSGEVEMQQGSSCWEGDEGAALCVDTIPPDPEHTPALAVTGGETLRIRWATGEAPEGVEATIERVDGDGRPASFPLEAANPTELTVDLPPGSFLLTLFTLWDRGDASFFARLDVG